MSKTTPGLKTVPRPNGTAGTGKRESPSRKDRAWLRAVGSIGMCMRCGIEIACQVAHRNMGKGLGVKVPDCLSASLCAPCHTALDNAQGMTRNESRSEMDRAIVMTLAELYRRGLVTISKGAGK